MSDRFDKVMKHRSDKKMLHREVILFFLMAFSFGIVFTFLSVVSSFVESFGGLVPFVVGAGLGVFLDIAVVRNVAVLNIFFHEIGHDFAALLCFRRMARFVVSRRTGGVYHRGRFRDDLADDVIVFGPYTFPTFFLISVLARPLLAPSWLSWVDLLVGLTFGLHLISVPRQLIDNWPRGLGAASEKTDIGEKGSAYSLIYILIINLTIQGLLLAMLPTGYGGIITWARTYYSLSFFDIVGIFMGFIICAEWPKKKSRPEPKRPRQTQCQEFPERKVSELAVA